ncbi:MAG: HDOD domain-containing protein [Gammaproteobacteria bacterium]|nr:HDOD domain-containing protein [Gammaproteobacteria bacterium]
MTTKSSDSVFIGRQPIFNSSLDIYAYELLYRSGHKNIAGVFDGNAATTNVILNSFMEIGFDNLVAGHKAFINLTHSFIDGSIPLPMTKKQVVLEILEDIPPEPEIIAQIQVLRDQGYIIALDDFIFDETMKPYINVANMIKVDVQLVDDTTLPGHVKTMKQNGIRMLAEKVETLEEFERYKEMGFDLFQGYFLSKPQVIEGKKLSSNTMILMDLLSKLQNPDIEFAELESLVARDAALSYKLLRYINSPAVGLGGKVDSVQRALLILGLDALKKWMTLLVMSGMSEKSDELIRTAMIRGKMCELLANNAGVEKANSYFTVGLFSLLDAMLDIRMSDILKDLPLEQRLNTALIEHKEAEGFALQCVIDYEEGRWDDMKYSDLSNTVIGKVYLEAIQWADQLMQGFQDTK